MKLAGLGLSLALLFVYLTASMAAEPASKDPPSKNERPSFKWVNRLDQEKYPQVRHATYRSKLMNVDVGYCIYLPPGYDKKKNAARRYPVVYYLHGGRPGSEVKSAWLSENLDAAMRSGNVPPMIYVFVNGGAVSHYNYLALKSPGETTFITELIPHVDEKYRTIADRAARGLEGFSQGGRGTARHMFKYPQLFSSAAPMGGGHQHEKRISESDGLEGEYKFTVGDNSYDLARKYAKRPQPPLRILVVVGTEDFNYEANLDYMRHLQELKIPFERIVVEDAPHSARTVYEKIGTTAIEFHANNFARAGKQGEKQKKADEGERAS